MGARHRHHSRSARTQRPRALPVALPPAEEQLQTAMSEGLQALRALAQLSLVHFASPGVDEEAMHAQLDRYIEKVSAAYDAVIAVLPQSNPMLLLQSKVPGIAEAMLGFMCEWARLGHAVTAHRVDGSVVEELDLLPLEFEIDQVMQMNLDERLTTFTQETYVTGLFWGAYVARGGRGALFAPPAWADDGRALNVLSVALANAALALYAQPRDETPETSAVAGLIHVAHAAYFALPLEERENLSERFDANCGLIEACLVRADMLDELDEADFYRLSAVFLTVFQHGVDGEEPDEIPMETKPEAQALLRAVYVIGQGCAPRSGEENEEDTEPADLFDLPRPTPPRHFLH